MVLFCFLQNFETNRDIENSPVRNIYSCRDRVWEPGETVTMSNGIDSQPLEGTYCPGGSRADVQLDVYSDQLMKGTYR